MCQLFKSRLLELFIIPQVKGHSSRELRRERICNSNRRKNSTETKRRSYIMLMANCHFGTVKSAGEQWIFYSVSLIWGVNESEWKRAHSVKIQIQIQLLIHQKINRRQTLLSRRNETHLRIASLAIKSLLFGLMDLLLSVWYGFLFYCVMCFDLMSRDSIWNALVCGMQMICLTTDFLSSVRLPDPKAKSHGKC